MPSAMVSSRSTSTLIFNMPTLLVSEIVSQVHIPKILSSNDLEFFAKNVC